MTKTSQPPKPPEPPNPDRLSVGVTEGEDFNLRAAEVLSGPFATNAIALNKFTRGTTGEVDLDKLVVAMTACADRVKNGDMKDVEGLLISQATVLNGLFADLVRRSAVNFSGNHFEAGERYLKLAFKAQNQSRMTLETLGSIKNPPTVYAKQANIAHGPQQVNNGQYSVTRTGDNENAQNRLLEASDEQPLDTGAPGAAGTCNSAVETVGTLYGPDESRRKASEQQKRLSRRVSRST